MPRRFLASAVAAAFLLPIGVSPANADAAVEVCKDASGQPVYAPQLQGPATISPYTDRLVAYGTANSDGNLEGWSGGDSTYSVSLTNPTRKAWFFSDTYIGTPGDWSIVHNSIVVDQDGGFTTHFGRPALINPPDTDRKFWMGGADVYGGKVWLMLNAFVKSGFEWTGSWVTSFSTSDLTKPAAPVQLFSGNVMWGSWLRFDGATAYVYGVKDEAGRRYAYVAKVPSGSLADKTKWQFWTGGSWSDPGAPDTVAKTITPAADDAIVSNEYSVAPYGGKLHILVSHHYYAGTKEIFAFFSCSAEGPFRAATKLLLYETEAGGDLVSYNAHEHPEMRSGNRLLVTYNRGPDAAYYRPVFLDVPLTAAPS